MSRSVDTAFEHLRSDPALSELIEEIGCLNLEKSEQPFKRLVVSIVNQQLSTQSAAAIRERLFEKFEIRPENLVEAEAEDLKSVGLSRQKVDYLKSAAERFIEDDLSLSKFEKMSDNEVIEELTQIHGVGVWTAKMFLIFVLAREDVFPVEDLGIRRGMETLYGEMSRGEMKDKAESWKPYRSFASLYVWKSVD